MPTPEDTVVPAYAAHLGAKYEYFKRNWKHFSYDLPSLKTPEDAAAFLMIAAIEADEQTSKYLTYNDGRSIEPVAALSQYRETIAVPGLEIALTKHFNLQAHGVNALNNLTQAAAYRSGIWTEATTLKFLELAKLLPLDEVSELRSGAMADQNPAHQAAENIQQICGAFIHANPEKAETVRTKLIEYISDFVRTADPNKAGAQLLGRAMLHALQQHATDQELSDIRETARALANISPDSKHYSNWVKSFPRVFTP